MAFVFCLLRSCLKRSYQDMGDQGSTPPSKTPRRDESQRGKQMSKQGLSMLGFFCCCCCLLRDGAFGALSTQTPKRVSHGRLFSRCSAVLLYVRTESEEVFDALMLNTPTLASLREAVSPEMYTHTHTHMQTHTHARRHIRMHARMHVHTHTHTHAHMHTHTQNQLEASSLARTAVLTLHCCSPQISEKYGIQKENIGKMYKKCKRG